MTELHNRSALALAKAVKDGEIGARELLEHFLSRVDRLNPAINAIIVQDRDRARRQADEADAAIKRGDVIGPLHGVPMTIKESYDWSGTPTTWGIPELRDNVVETEAVSVERLVGAGAIIFGKTNVPIRLADFQSYNDIYGTTNNPWDLDRTPGGSSGGSAAALAAGLTGLEIGSDIGGSIRNPAHFCGVFGHKPSWGLASSRGHALGGALTPTDIAVVGPLARSAGDLETALSLMSEPDLIEAHGGPRNLKGLGKATRELKVAVWMSDPFCPASEAVADRVQAVAKALAGEGAAIDMDARPRFAAEESHEIFSKLLWSAMAGRVPDEQFAQMTKKADALAPDDMRPSAQMLRAQTMRARDWSILNERRTRLRWAWREFFERYDVLLTPIMPTPAFLHDHRPEGQRTLDVDGRTIPYYNQTFWAGLAGVAYLPATIVPAAQGRGLPIGVQIVGPYLGDMKTIDLARRLEALGFAFAPPPGYE